MMLSGSGGGGRVPIRRCRRPFIRNHTTQRRASTRRVCIEPGRSLPAPAAIHESFVPEDDQEILQIVRPIPQPNEIRMGENHGANADVNLDPEAVEMFTIYERLFMIGARNFFLPTERPDSIYCIDCYKRGGFHSSVILVVICMFLLSSAVLHPLHMVGRQVFIAKAYQNMFLTDQDYFPIIAILFVYLIMIMAGWTVHYTQNPTYDAGFFLYLNSSRLLLLMGSIVLIWHVWTYASYYPDESFVSNLRFVMAQTLSTAQREYHETKNQDSWANLKYSKMFQNTERRVWDDTQSVFKCCGIKNHQDWLPSDVTPDITLKNFSKYVPRSCCPDATPDSNCEAMFVYKDGCLQAQVKGLTGESLWVVSPGLSLAFFAYLALYLIIGRLFSNTAALTRRGRIFDLPPPPPPPAPDPRPQHPI